jgi:hypothetical protein
MKSTTWTRVRCVAGGRFRRRELVLLPTRPIRALIRTQPTKLEVSNTFLETRRISVGMTLPARSYVVS